MAQVFTVVMVNLQDKQHAWLLQSRHEYSLQSSTGTAGWEGTHCQLHKGCTQADDGVRSEQVSCVLTQASARHSVQGEEVWPVHKDVWSHIRLLRVWGGDQCRAT